MNGLIYKDIVILLKGMKPLHYLGIIAVVAASYVLGGDFGSLFASLIITLFLCIYSFMAVSFDEKARWHKYEITLPTGRRKSITSKYILVLLLIMLNTVAATLLFFLGSLLISSLNWIVFWLQIGIAIILPLLWNTFSIPLAYGVGYQGTSYMGVIFVLPIFFLTKYFEDGSGMLPSADTLKFWGFIGVCCTIVIFGISYLISVAIHNRKEYK